MVKKESAERGYMTPEEVREHSKDYDHLHKLFSRGRRRLLSKGTKDSIKQVIGEIAIDTHLKGGVSNVINKDYARKTLDEFANQVKFFHDVYKPDYVFLTETSSTPIGYILKEAWKTAYPGEKPPVFLRIIPGRGNKEFFEKRIKNKDAKIFVYDEFVETAGSLISVGNSLKRAGYENIMLGRSGRDRGIHDDAYARYGDKPKFSTPDYFFRFELKGSEKRNQTNYEIVEKAGFGNSPRLRDSLGSVTYKGWDKTTNSFSYKRRKVKGDVGEIIGNTAVVHTYKAMGKYVGEYIASEAQKKEREASGGLEKTFATVSVISLIGSLFFLSSNVTGNAIANLNVQNSSFLGAGLLIVGLVAGFFWVKSRKK